jgi:hypothetical protein
MLLAEFDGQGQAHVAQAHHCQCLHEVLLHQAIPSNAGIIAVQQATPATLPPGTQGNAKRHLAQ